MNDNLELLAMMKNVVDKKIDQHLIQQVNKICGKHGTDTINYFNILKLDYPQQDTSHA